LCEESPPIVSVELWQTDNASDAWAELIRPWLERVVRVSFSHSKPSVLVCPSRAHRNGILARMHEAGIRSVAVHFLTPVELRPFLSARLGVSQPVALREHLHLLLAAAAERVCAVTDEDSAEWQTAESVARDPGPLLRSYDEVCAAGWTWREAGLSAFGAVLQEFETAVRACGLLFLHEADAALLDAAQQGAPALADVLVTGFDGAHWPQWKLLRSAVGAGERVTMILPEPVSEAGSLHALWSGSWEQIFGASRPVPSSGDAPDGFAFSLRAGANRREQARAVVLSALECLAGDAVRRVGLVFAGTGALPRQVSSLLAEMDVPHDDGLAHPQPGPFEMDGWRAWLAFQDAPNAESLIELARRTAHSREMLGGLDMDVFEEQLRRAVSRVLLTDCAMLAAWLEAQASHPAARDTARVIREVALLPASAMPGEMLSVAHEAATALGWREQAEEMERLAGAWMGEVSLPVSRRLFIRWLREAVDSSCKVRGAGGNHPYARLHLVTYAQAVRQQWDALVLADLEEGAWPGPARDGFVSAQLVEELNLRSTGLNERTKTQGAQGEGHVTVREGFAPMLGARQRRALALRAFAYLLEGGPRRLVAVARLFDEEKPVLRLNPGELLIKLYAERNGAVLSHRHLEKINAQTRDAISDSGLWSDADEAADFPQMLAAARARRTEGVFGEYEFALRDEVAGVTPVALACKEWENVLRAPALAWLENVLGVSARRGDAVFDPWTTAVGSWAHRFLSAIPGAVNQFQPFRGQDEFAARVAESAQRFRRDMEGVAGRAGRVLPDWWHGLFEQAVAVSRTFARQLATVREWEYFAAELPLPDGTRIDAGAGLTLDLRGRIDLLFSRAAGFAGEGVWIVDFKTGGRGKLKSADVKKGVGMQLALYALAAEALGARAAGASVLAGDEKLDGPDLSLGDFHEMAGTWRGLARMQTAGVFGMTGEVRGAFRSTGTYPLATLPIDADLLAVKWAATHPELVE
jgi:hypothetical protein